MCIYIYILVVVLSALLAKNKTTYQELVWGLPGEGARARGAGMAGHNHKDPKWDRMTRSSSNRTSVIYHYLSVKRIRFRPSLLRANTLQGPLGIESSQFGIF